GVAAYFDGFLYQKQMHKHGIIYGYSLMEHGGWWIDLVVMNLIVSLLIEKYEFNYSLFPGFVYLVVISIAWYALTISYAKSGAIMPEAHCHNGKTTMAGWIHLV